MVWIIFSIIVMLIVWRMFRIELWVMKQAKDIEKIHDRCRVLERD